MIHKLRAIWTLIQLYRSIGNLVLNPTFGAFFLVKHPVDTRFRMVLFRRHVSARWDMYGKANPADRLGRSQYRVIADYVEWPFPADAFPGGWCPMCYTRVDRMPEGHA